MCRRDVAGILSCIPALRKAECESADDPAVAFKHVRHVPAEDVPHFDGAVCGARGEVCRCGVDDADVDRGFVRAADDADGRDTVFVFGAGGGGSLRLLGARGQLVYPQGQ